MLTQALPYSSQQQQQRPLPTSSDSRCSSKRFSLRSLHSTSSSVYSTQPEELAATSETSASSTAIETKPKNFQNFVRSLRLRKSQSSEFFKRTTSTTGDARVEADDEMEMLSSAERPRDAAAKAAELKAKRSSVDTVLAWALHMYPGAAPTMGWY
jgi:hypothetical protein